MKAHDTPSGTRMMWNASVNAIWPRAHGTGLTASTFTRATSSTRETFSEVRPDAQRVRDDRQGRVHRADRREEARVDQVQVVEFVGLAVDVEHRRLRIGAEAGGSGLVGGRRDVHRFVKVQLALVQPFMHADVA